MPEEMEDAVALLDAAHADMAAAIVALEEACGVERFTIAREALDATYHALMG